MCILSSILLISIICNSDSVVADINETPQYVKDNLILSFKEISSEYKQGGCPLSLKLSNKGSKDIIFREWLNDHISNNFGVIAKNKSRKIFNLYDDYTSCSAISSIYHLPAKKKKIFKLVFICNLPPGNYEIQAYMKYYPNIKTKWHSVKITKGKLIDTRK